MTIPHTGISLAVALFKFDLVGQFQVSYINFKFEIN